jgi:hypothetical protein
LFLRGKAQLRLVFIRQEYCLQTNLQAACIFDESILASLRTGAKEGWSVTARRTAVCTCMLPARRILSTTGFMPGCFIIFHAAGVRTLLSLSTDHGSAAAAPAKAAAVAAEKAAATAGSAAAAAMAAGAAMATEAGAMTAAAAASSTLSTHNFFF